MTLSGVVDVVSILAINAVYRSVPEANHDVITKNALVWSIVTQFSLPEVDIAPSEGTAFSMQINSYLHFNGTCEEAFNFYAATFHGKIDALMLWGGSPAGEHTPLDWHGKVLHAKLVVGNSIILGSDNRPDCYEHPQGFSVSINFTSIAETERVFAALSEGGIIDMPLEKTFWASRFGMITDRFGTPWMLNCEVAE